MPTITDGSSDYAPALAQMGNILAAVYVSDGGHSLVTNQMYMSLYDLNTLTLSNSKSLDTHKSELRPAAGVWNGNIYFLYVRTSNDNLLGYGMTDMVSFLEANCIIIDHDKPYADFIPYIAPFGETLYASFVKSDTKNTINIISADSGWLLNHADNGPWRSGSNITINSENDLHGSQMLPIYTDGQVVYVLLYRKNDKSVHALSSLNADFSKGISSSVSSGAPSDSFQFATVNDGLIYCFWSVTTGASYAVGTPGTDGSVTWSAAKTAPSAPENITDISCTSGPAGVFVGYRDKAGTLTFARLSD